MDEAFGGVLRNPCFASSALTGIAGATGVGFINYFRAGNAVVSVNKGLKWGAFAAAASWGVCRVQEYMRLKQIGEAVKIMNQNAKQAPSNSRPVYNRADMAEGKADADMFPDAGMKINIKKT